MIDYFDSVDARILAELTVVSILGVLIYVVNYKRKRKEKLKVLDHPYLYGLIALEIYNIIVLLGTMIILGRYPLEYDNIIHYGAITVICVVEFGLRIKKEKIRE